MLSEVFWVAFISTASTTFIFCIKYLLKSKCEHFTLFWGLVKIDRRVDLETQIDLKEIEDGGEKTKKESENKE